MSDPYSAARRTVSSSRTQHGSETRQRNDDNIDRRLSREGELNKAKRKSNAYLAAEAVQQERDAIKTLKRLSMGGSLTLDPDLPFGVDNEFGDFQTRHTRRRSSSGSSISSNNSLEGAFDDDAEKTLIEDPTMDNTLNDEDEDIKIDSERLMWVPATAHPSIAPDQFRRHVQSTLDDMTKKQHPNHKSSDSIPSLKELTDELDKLSEIAGLAATDAVTLARSLSSASSSSSLLYGEDSSPNLLSSPDAGRSSEVTRVSEDEVDQDAPLLSVGNSLKRNKWTTYTRRNRTDKDKYRRRHSPLSDEHFKAFQESNNFGEYSKQLPPQPEKSLPPQPSHRSVSQGEPPRDVTREQHKQLSRSQSDITSAAKRTNHARNRHAGSLINIDATQDGPSHQQKNTPPPISKNSQDIHAQRRISPLSVDVRAAERENRSRPQAFHQNQAQAQTSTPPTPRTPPLQQQQYQQQYIRPETQVSQEVPEPPTPAPAQTVVKEKEKENKSKSKEFLNMFKMKRSTSPKSKDKKKTITPTRSTFFNDENVPSGSNEKSYPSQHYHRQPSPTGQHSQHEQEQQQPQQQQIPHPPQQKSPQRPSLRPNSFKLMKQREDPKQKEQRSLQESVKVVPKNSSRSPSASSFQQQKSPEPSAQPTTPTGQQFPVTPTTPGTPEEQHRAQKELLARKLSKENIQKSSKPNAPVQFTDSAFGFPLPPLSHSTIIMLDYRFPVHVERALYRLSHLKLANPRRPLRQQVLLSNFMYAYLNLVNHTLYLQQLDEENNGEAGEAVEHGQEA